MNEPIPIHDVPIRIVLLDTGERPMPPPAVLDAVTGQRWRHVASMDVEVRPVFPALDLSGDLWSAPISGPQKRATITLGYVPDDPGEIEPPLPRGFTYLWTDFAFIVQATGDAAAWSGKALGREDATDIRMQL